MAIKYNKYDLTLKCICWTTMCIFLLVGINFILLLTWIATRLFNAIF